MGSVQTLKDLRYPKTRRLVSNHQFKAVLNRRQRAGDRLLTLFVAKNSTGNPRLGISVGKSCGNAVVRNRLKRLLEDPRVLKVFHFARFDVAALAHWLGIAVSPLYCTRTASKLARTYTDRHGLKDNLLELLDVELDKVTRHSDWSSLSLSPEQVRYAISDVTLLLPLMDRLEDMLRRQGRAELARECFGVIPTLAKLDLAGFELLFEH